MALLWMPLEVLRRPTTTVWDVLMEMTILMLPLWLAVFVGVVVGWAWKPKWANLNLPSPFSAGSSSWSSSATATATAAAAALTLLPRGFPAAISSFKLQFPASLVTRFAAAGGLQALSFPASQLGELRSDSSLSEPKSRSSLVNEADFKHLWQLVEIKDGGPPWIQMMDRSTPTMSYQAWRRDPQTGPPQYRSRTVYENATPEAVRDFFWDDEFRCKWDDMLLFHETLEESETTGAMMVHWTRKFPFFCSHREYVIGRRIWASSGSYYCVTKGVPCSSVPRRDKPRRVDLYYSSWCIRAAESRKRGDTDGQATACEVMLFHHEDMGIPWEIAKLGVRQGMWGTVKKIEPGLRAYQKERAAGAPLSRSALMAHVNTKVGSDYLRDLETDGSELPVDAGSPEKGSGMNIPKLLLVGGAIALAACSLDKGLLTKAVIFGVARKFVRIGREVMIQDPASLS
ncbi:hypothetical protein Dimus_009005 [Dionaea muscipula]